MSKNYISLILVLVGLVLTVFSTTAETIHSKQKDESVIELWAQTQPFDPNAPRTPALIPISCSFDDSSLNLYFTFLFPLGNVTITLTEASAGVVSSDEYSTASCLLDIPVPGPGTYTLTIALESGAEYIGQFVY